MHVQSSQLPTCFLLAFEQDLQAAITIGFNTIQSDATSLIASSDDGVLLCESIKFGFRSPALRFLAFANSSDCLDQQPRMVRPSFGCSQVRSNARSFAVVGESAVDQGPGEVFLLSSSNFSKTVSHPLLGLAKDAAVAMAGDLVYVVEVQFDIKTLAVQAYGFDQPAANLGHFPISQPHGVVEGVCALASADLTQLYITWSNSMNVLVIHVQTGLFQTLGQGGERTWGSPNSILMLTPDSMLAVLIGDSSELTSVKVYSPNGTLHNTLPLRRSRFDVTYGFVTMDILWMVQQTPLSNSGGRLENTSTSGPLLSVMRTLSTMDWSCGYGAGYSNGYVMIACDSASRGNESRLLFYKLESAQPVRSWCALPSTTTAASTTVTITTAATVPIASTTMPTTPFATTTTTTTTTTITKPNTTIRTAPASRTFSSSSAPSFSSIGHLTDTPSSSYPLSSSPAPIAKAQKPDHFLEFVSIAVGITFVATLALVFWYYRFKKRVVHSFHEDLVPVGAVS